MVTWLFLFIICCLINCWLRVMHEFLTSPICESSHSSLKLMMYSASMLWSSRPPVPARFFWIWAIAPEVFVIRLVMVWMEDGSYLLLIVDTTFTLLELGVCWSSPLWLSSICYRLPGLVLVWSLGFRPAIPKRAALFLLTSWEAYLWWN